MRIVYIICLGLLASLYSCNDKPNPEPPKGNPEAARSVSVQIGRALNSKDAEMLKAHIAADALFMRTNAPAARRDEFVSSYANGFKGINYNISFSSEELAPAGEFVIERGLFKGDVKSVDGSVTTPVTGKYLHVLKGDSGGSWKIWRGAWEFDLSLAESCPSGRSCCCTNISGTDCILTPPGGCPSDRPTPILAPYW